jgi:5-methylcytosine-specific restriction protein A
MARAEFSAKTKVLAFQRAAGFCEGIVMHDQAGMVLCGARLTVGKFAYDHVVADGLRKDNSLANCAVLCLPCHAAKTRGDVRAIARAKRIERKHLGISKAKGPIAGRGFHRSERMKDKTPKADALRAMREQAAPRIGAFKVEKPDTFGRPRWKAELGRHKAKAKGRGKR